MVHRLIVHTLVTNKHEDVPSYTTLAALAVAVYVTASRSRLRRCARRGARATDDLALQRAPSRAPHSAPLHALTARPAPLAPRPESPTARSCPPTVLRLRPVNHDVDTNDERGFRTPDTVFFVLIYKRSMSRYSKRNLNR